MLKWRINIICVLILCGIQHPLQAKTEAIHSLAFGIGGVFFKGESNPEKIGTIKYFLTFQSQWNPWIALTNRIDYTLDDAAYPTIILV